MGNKEFTGSVSKLAAPVTVGGTVFSHVLKFIPPGSETYEIVSGTIDSVVDAGGGIYKVICRRGTLNWSRTIAAAGPGQGATEKVETSVCGTNIVNAPEPLRLYSWVSETANRGDMRRARMVPNDPVFFGPPGAEESFFSTDAEALSVAPSSVNFVADSVGPTVTYIDTDFIDVRLPLANRETNRLATPDWELNSGMFFATGLYAGTTFTKLTRRQFTPPGALSTDPFYYPVGAELPIETYWFDPLKMTFALSSNNVAYGNTLLAIWFEKNLERDTGSIAFPIVVEGAGAGYDGTADADETTGMVTSSSQDWDVVIFLNKGDTANYGTGAIEWDFPSVSRKVAVTWSAGAITGVLARTSDGGPMAAQSFTPYTFSTGLQDFIRVQKVGGTVRFYRGSPSVLIGEVNFGTTVREKVFGRLGVHSWGGNRVSFQAFEGLTMEKSGQITGVIYKMRSQNWSDLVYSRDYVTTSTALVSSVVSRISGVIYSAGTTSQKKGYYDLVAANTLRFSSESAGDSLRVEQVASGSVPAGPGLAPRVTTGITNLATAGIDGIATTDVNENRLNWKDVFWVHAPGGFSYGPGDSFVVRSHACRDTTDNTWIIQTAIRHGDDTADTFATIDKANLRPVGCELIFLLAKDWVDNNVDVTDSLCVRYVGDYRSNHGPYNARAINEIVQAIEVTDDLDGVSTRGGAADGTEIGGWCQQVQPVWSGMECDGVTPGGRATGLMMGTTRQAWETLANYMVKGGLALPTPIFGPTDLAILHATGSDDPSGFTTANNAVFTGCNPPGGGAGFNLQQFGTNARISYVWPWVGVPAEFRIGSPTSNYFGTLPNAFRWDPTRFRFTGIPFGVPDRVVRALKGSTIKRAFLEVKFTGVEARTWAWSESGYFGRTAAALSSSFPAANGEFSMTINGSLRREYIGGSLPGGPVDWANPDPEPFASSGSVGFMAIGQRLNSDLVFLSADFAYWQDANPSATAAETAAARNYYTRSVPNGAWGAVGSGGTVGTTISTGYWSAVDVTALCQGMLDNGRVSELRRFQLFPTIGGVDVSSSVDSLAGYLASLSPTVGFSANIHDASFFEFALTASGLNMFYDQLQVRELVLCVERPSGHADIIRMGPLIRGGMVG